MDKTALTVHERSAWDVAARERRHPLIEGVSFVLVEGIFSWWAIGIEPPVGRLETIAYVAIAVGLGLFVLYGVRALEYCYHSWHTVPLEKLWSAREELTARVGQLEAQLDKEWRRERKEFEHELALPYRNNLTSFLSTVEAILIREGFPQVTTTWHDYLPQNPLLLDENLIGFASHLWKNWLTIWGDKQGLHGFKKRFRVVTGYFDHVYDLVQDFPAHAPQYVEENVKRNQFDVLHLVWYLGYGLAEDTYGSGYMEEVYEHPPRWLRLWDDWNPGVDLLRSPREILGASAGPVSEEELKAAGFLPVGDEEE